MSSNKPSCPIWEEPPALTEIPNGGQPCNSPRAGGRFLLEYDGAEQLKFFPLTDRQKATLSYWIYEHNLEHRQFDESPAGQPLVLDEKWVVAHRDRTPSAEDRMLMFLRELIRCDDAGEQPNEDLSCIPPLERRTPSATYDEARGFCRRTCVTNCC